LAEAGASHPQEKCAMTRLLHNRSLSMLVRIALGVIFVLSSWSKIADPPGFAHMLWNYKILPDALINPAALLLPWVEATAGLALIAGIWSRGAAVVVVGMLIAFSAGLATDLVRGIAIDCGCFSVAATNRTPAELMLDMKLELLRDLGMLLMAVQVLWSRANGWKSGSIQEGLATNFCLHSSEQK
jgi:uncharacterized membrane protein YphA (DoxX/SURF4 family)